MFHILKKNLNGQSVNLIKNVLIIFIPLIHCWRILSKASLRKFPELWDDTSGVNYDVRNFSRSEHYFNLDEEYLTHLLHLHSAGSFRNVCNIFTFVSGRGTVCTGKVERGKIKKGEPVEIMGFNKLFKCTINGKFSFCRKYNFIYLYCI